MYGFVEMNLHIFSILISDNLALLVLKMYLLFDHIDMRVRYIVVQKHILTIIVGLEYPLHDLILVFANVPI